MGKILRASNSAMVSSTIALLSREFDAGLFFPFA
jgi:hypothetical protein